MFLAWAAYYEGATDSAYFDVIIPRLLDDILMADGTRPINVPEAPALKFGLSSRDVGHVAEEICSSRDAFHLLFVHADTGGRGLHANIANRREAFGQAAFDLCEWPLERTVYLSPRHETEAWALADRDAVCRSLGYTGTMRGLGLPTSGGAADRLVDPKATLDRTVFAISGRSYRANGGLLTSIAQEQSLTALRTSPSFREFEVNLRGALATLGCLPQG